MCCKQILLQQHLFEWQQLLPCCFPGYNRSADSQITQILPEILSERESVQALSFALHQAVKKLCHYCENISVFSSIDSAPEKVLDLLAGEMDTQYYDDSLPINVKRQLIKNTLPWYMGTGTPGALEELVTAVAPADKNRCFPRTDIRTGDSSRPAASLRPAGSAEY